MKVFVMNCGSPSLKYQLIDMENESVLTGGLCGRIGIGSSLLTHTSVGGEKYKVETAMPSHKEAIELVMQALVDPSRGVIKNTDETSAAGHRVIHGGIYYSESVLVSEDMKKAITDCFNLAPLHNPANLVGIEACGAVTPGKPSATMSDTTFGMSIPGKAYLYALPYEYYEKHKVRRYGFHGTNHDFVAGEVIRRDGLDPESAKVIVCHLGNGASVSASINGKCVDTSMGLTPLESLIMGTHFGDIDPAIIQFICEHKKLTAEEMTDVLNKKSDVLGLSNGVSSDPRDIDDAANGDSRLMKVALETYTLCVAKYIGVYVVVMSGVDAIAFTADVDENNEFMRKSICAYLGYLSVKIDDERNNIYDEERLISTDDSRVRVYFPPTNEKLAIARDTLKLAR